MKESICVKLKIETIKMTKISREKNPVADVMIKNQKVNPAVTANDLNLGDESCILNRINECYEATLRQSGNSN